MAFLTELWLPILLSAILVFVVSSILWMATPLHKKDFLPPPNEDGLMSVIKTHNFGPGSYYVPWCGNPGAQKDPTFQAKMKSGPWAMLTVMSNAPSFAQSLALWFASQLIVSAIIAYAAAAALTMGAGAPDYLKVFQVVGAIAFLANAAMAPQDSIWKGVSWTRTAVRVFDGLVYALVTAGTFAWLWPRELAG